MSTCTSLPITQESSPKEDEEHNKICNEHKQLIETTPKGNGWRVRHIYNYNGFWLNPHTLKANLLLKTYFKSKPSDIFLASFMKSGTTWLKALMFSIINRNRYTLSKHPLLHNGPQSTFPLLDGESYPITNFNDFRAPRLFGTHFALTLLPQCMTSCKIVYVCRDPKDVLISKWHFMSKLRSKDLPPLSFNKAFELFCNGVSEYGPFWEHVLSYWRASLESPDMILFLKYEEMKRQPELMVRKLAEFMGRAFTAEEEDKGMVKEIVNLCSFENLSNLEVNKNGFEKFGKLAKVENRDFFRKGEVGDWKNYLSEDMKERIDGITDHKFKGSGLSLTPRV